MNDIARKLAVVLLLLVVLAGVLFWPSAPLQLRNTGEGGQAGQGIGSISEAQVDSHLDDSSSAPDRGVAERSGTERELQAVDRLTGTPIELALLEVWEEGVRVASAEVDGARVSLPVYAYNGALIRFSLAKRPEFMLEASLETALSRSEEGVLRLPVLSGVRGTLDARFVGGVVAGWAVGSPDPELLLARSRYAALGKNVNLMQVNPFALDFFFEDQGLMNLLASSIVQKGGEWNLAYETNGEVRIHLWHPVHGVGEAVVELTRGEWVDATLYAVKLPTMNGVVSIEHDESDPIEYVLIKVGFDATTPGVSQFECTERGWGAIATTSEQGEFFVLTKRVSVSDSREFSVVVPRAPRYSVYVASRDAVGYVQLEQPFSSIGESVDVTVSLRKIDEFEARSILVQSEGGEVLSGARIRVAIVDDAKWHREFPELVTDELGIANVPMTDSDEVIGVAIFHPKIRGVYAANLKPGEREIVVPMSSQMKQPQGVEENDGN